MNMLSTPMASTRNGTTSFTIIVMVMPAYETTPIALAADTPTMRMPWRPRPTRVLTGCGKRPRASTMYANMAT
jgi:hypothetical protein